MEFIIIFVIAYFIIKAVTKGDSSTSKSTSTSVSTTSPEAQSLIESFFDRDSHGNITNRQSYYKTLQECYDRHGNIMFLQDVMISFLHGYDLYENLGLSLIDIERDLEKISRGERLYTPSKSSPLDDEKYRSLLEDYYEKYRNQVFQEKYLYEIQQKIHIEKGIAEIKSDLKMIRKELDYEPPVQPQSKQIQTTSNTVYQQYIDALEQYYIENEGKVFDFSLINSFIIKYNLDKRYDIEIYEVFADLMTIELNHTHKLPCSQDIEYWLYFFKKAYGVTIKYNGVPCETLLKEIRLGNIDIPSITPSAEPLGKHTQTTSNTPYAQGRQTKTVSSTSSVQVKQTKTVENTAQRKNSTFYSYVVNMSNTQLVNTINGQYKAIKGTWSVAPCMGEYGSIEFAAVLLLWRYAVGSFDRNRESYASLQITLGDIIGCSFFGMPAGEWSDKKDPILNAHSDILTLEEFGDVYNHLKDNIIDEIHQMEFNNGNAKAEVYRQLYTKFIQIYNSANDFLDMLEYYTEKGLKIKESMSFSNSNQDARKALLLQNWESGWEDFIEDVDIPPTLTDKFYVSSYRCPNCGRHMYKAVFPIGKEFPINIGNGKMISMKRIFTCSKCQIFYTPLPEHKLSYGQCYFLKLAQTAEYRLLLETYDSHSTTTGRPDA